MLNQNKIKSGTNKCNKKLMAKAIKEEQGINPVTGHIDLNQGTNKTNRGMLSCIMAIIKQWRDNIQSIQQLFKHLR